MSEYTEQKYKDTWAQFKKDLFIARNKCLLLLGTGVKWPNSVKALSEINRLISLLKKPILPPTVRQSFSMDLGIFEGQLDRVRLEETVIEKMTGYFGKVYDSVLTNPILAILSELFVKYQQIAPYMSEYEEPFLEKEQEEQKKLKQESELEKLRRKNEELEEEVETWREKSKLENGGDNKKRRLTQTNGHNNDNKELDDFDSIYETPFTLNNQNNKKVKLSLLDQAKRFLTTERYSRVSQELDKYKQSSTNAKTCQEEVNKIIQEHLKDLESVSETKTLSVNGKTINAKNQKDAYEKTKKIFKDISSFGDFGLKEPTSTIENGNKK